jgi:hypothetical protein
MKLAHLSAALALAALSLTTHAAIVDIDLSGAVSGNLIDGVGADFAQAFAGQSVSGIALTGAATNPLALQPVGEIDVAFWDPGVSPASNSLLSQPGNAAPLAILLDSNANSFNWTAGSADGGTTFTATFYAANGSVVGSQSIVTLPGYATYSLSGLGTFRGVAFSDNIDSAGLRFQNMSYNAAPVPEAPVWAMMTLGLAAAGAVVRRKNAAGR